MLIKNYEKGSDITILNTIYHYPKKNEKGKWDNGSITLIYRDNVTGVKHNCNIDNPNYTFFFAKEETQIDNNELFIEKEKVDPITVPYRDLEKKIAELTGNLDFYYDNIRNGNRRANSKLHEHPKVFNSDTNIEEHYRLQFDMEYTNESFFLKKTYFDIEVDGINKRGIFPELGECPVNAITAINEFENKTYTFLLRNKENPLIEEFEKSINEDLFKELKDFIRNQVHGWKNEIRFGLDKMDYEFLFYDNEVDLIVDFFRLMNIKNPDFAMAWNMKFDIPYLIERLRILGIDPASVMCNPEFKIKEARYSIDGMHDAISEKGDYAVISSYIVYIDQMIQFASRRKSKASSFDSMKLDYIGSIIAGIHKLDYSHITTKIEQLPYLNYKIFVFYNIMDTIVQKCIECKTGDIDYTFNKCLINNTRYPKGHRQSVYLVNRGNKEFRKDGLIIGNNINKSNPKVPYPGAEVADPRKLNAYSKYKLNKSYAINICDNCDDFDYKSLYPSLIIENNMAPNTQIGKIIIEKMIFAGENPFNSDIFDRGGKFLEDLHSWNFLEFSQRWLHLASFKDLYKDIIDYLNNVYMSSRMINVFDNNGARNVMRRTNGLQLNPLYRTDNGIVRVMNRYNEMPDCTDIYNINVNEVVYYG